MSEVWLPLSEVWRRDDRIFACSVCGAVEWNTQNSSPERPNLCQMARYTRANFVGTRSQKRRDHRRARAPLTIEVDGPRPTRPLLNLASAAYAGTSGIITNRLGTKELERA